MIIPPFAPIGHYRPAEGGWAMGCFVSTRRVFVARVCPLIRSRKPSEPGKRPFAKLQRRSGSSPRPFPTSETRGRNSKSVGTKSKSAGTKSKSGGTKSKSGGTKSKPHFLPRIQPFQWLIADFDREGNSQAASPKRASIPPTRGSSDWRSRRPWRNEPSFWRSDNETDDFSGSQEFVDRDEVSGSLRTVGSFGPIRTKFGQVFPSRTADPGPGLTCRLSACFHAAAPS